MHVYMYTQMYKRWIIPALFKNRRNLGKRRQIKTESIGYPEVSGDNWLVSQIICMLDKAGDLFVKSMEKKKPNIQ